MAQILFYHLERSDLSSVLPGLLEKTVRNNWTATVRLTHAVGVREIDDLLWTYSEVGFLPHGTTGDGADHPIWITAEPDAQKPGAELLFLIQGATAKQEELGQLLRCVTIFDGADEEAVVAARQFWKESKAAKHEVTYWKQTAIGKWEKQG